MKKKFLSVLFALVLALGFSLVTLGPMATPALAASGDFQTRQAGNWNAQTTWIKSLTGTAAFTNGSNAVTGTGTLFLTELAPGDVLMLQASPATVRGAVASITDNTHLTLVAVAGATISGTYGKQAVPSSADGVITITHAVTVTADVTVDQVVNSAAFTVSSGATLTVADGPGTDFATGSSVAITINGTLNVNGTMSGSSSFTISNTGIVNVSTGSTLTVNQGGSPTLTVNGTLSVSVAGTVTGAHLITIGNGGTATVSGTMNVTTGNGDLEINAGGNLNITGGSIAVSSVATVNVSGTITMSGASTLSVFRGNGGTLIVVSSGGQISMSDTALITSTTSAATADVVTMNSGSTLIMGPSAIIGGNGEFFLNSGASMSIGSADGITSSGATGNIRVSSTRSYNTGANYTYNGTLAQVTGNGLPATVNNLTINNANGVTLTGNMTVSTNLALTSGDLTTGANTLTMANAATTTGDYDVVGTVKRTSPTAGAKTYGSTYTSLNFGSAVTGDVTVNLAKTAPSGFTKYVKRTYALSKPAGAGSADVRLHYRSPEDLFGSPVESALGLWRYDAGSWVLQGRDSGASSSGASWVQKNGVSTFSNWAIAVSSNQAPVATVSLNTATPKTNDTLTATATKSDPDGDTVTLTCVWKVNDTVKKTTSASSSLTDTFDLSVAGNGDKGDIIKVEVTPNDGTVDGTMVSGTATVQNTAPVMSTATITSSDATHAFETSTLTASGTATDADPGDSLTYSYEWFVGGLTTGQTGTTLNGTYFNKTDSVTCKISASDGSASSPLLVSNIITIENTAPVADDQSVTTNEDTAVAITLTASDVDGDSLPYSVDTSPANGALTGAAPNLTYTPGLNYNGGDSFTFKANDGTDDSNTATVSITINQVNDPPSFTKGSDQTVNEDAGAQSVSWATAISAGPADESGQALAFIIDSNDNSGLFSAGPAVTSDGTLTYTPAPNANGVANIGVKLQDNGGTTNGGIDTSAVQTFTITVTAVNDAPVVSDIPDQTIAEGSTFATINLDDYVSDVDNTDVQMIWNSSGGTDLTVTIDASRVATIGIPNADWNGAETITFTATDPGSLSDSYDATFTVTATFTQTPYGGGGGGGGGGIGGLPAAYAACPVTLALDMQGNITTVKMTNQGVLCAACVANDAAGKYTIQLDSGTKVMLAGNTVPLILRFRKTSVTPPTPENAVIVGPVYELNAYSSTFETTPSPITISPPARLILTYDPDELPKNTSELFIANYDTEEGWRAFTSVPGVAAEAGRVYGLANRLSLFAVLAKIAAPAPAKFEVSNLTVSPSQAQLNQEVAISVNVTNTGGTSGSYNLELKVNGISKSTKQVTVAAGTSQPVNFTITGDAVGKHQVEVAGLTGEFEITKAAKQSQINWWLIGGIIVAIILALAIWIFMRRRRFSY